MGCSSDNKYLDFAGESENWQGVYTTTINTEKSSENGKYLLSFKETSEEVEFKNFEIIIDNGEVEQKEVIHKGSTVEIPVSCSGCAVTDENEDIRVTIKWDDVYEETILLERK
ncbi:hypothetical protein [Sporosarcina koreensis]|uniref:Lipoprotein n=1 Tax=Sporosarcina koreensis TaxID=334735 RepID=A0ABW0TWW5_9BACL